MGYKWKLDFGGFTLEVRKPEHGVKHCHAVKHPDCEAVFSLEDGSLLEYPKGFSARDLKAISKAILANQKLLLDTWSKLNG